MAGKSFENFVLRTITKRGYPSFWIINTLGWIIFVSADTFIVSAKLVLSSWHNFLDNTLEWSAGYFSTIGLRFIYKKIDYKSKSILTVLGIFLICSLVASCICFLLLTLFSL